MHAALLAVSALALVACKSPLGRPFSDDERALHAVQLQIDVAEREKAEITRQLEKDRALEAYLRQKVEAARKGGS